MVDLVLDLKNIAGVAQQVEHYHAVMNPEAKVQALQGSHAQSYIDHMSSQGLLLVLSSPKEW